MRYDGFVSSPRIVQTGSGRVRPLLLVFHTSERHDAALRSAMGPSALIVSDTTPGSTYGDTPPLATTVASLKDRFGVQRFAPTIVAGFSAGGFATRQILTQGGDPDALVIADGTYASAPSGYAQWKDYAERAKRGQRVMLASNTSLIVTSSTWHVLSDITGVTLPLGPSVANRPAGVPVLYGSGPAVLRQGQLLVFSYPTDDSPGHEQQAAAALPMMLRQAMTMLASRGAMPGLHMPSARVIGSMAGVGAVAVIVGVALVASRRAQ